MRLLFVLVCFALSTLAYGATAQTGYSTGLGGSSLNANAGQQVLDGITAPLSSIGATGGPFTIYTGDYNATITSAHFDGFNKNGSPYVVTTGYHFVTSDYCATTSGTVEPWQLVSATASIGQNAASLTGGVYQSGSSGVYPKLTSTTANVETCYHETFCWPQGTYPGFQTQYAGNWAVSATGVEVSGASCP